jgi:hypothetical protein
LLALKFLASVVQHSSSFSTILANLRFFFVKLLFYILLNLRWGKREREREKRERERKENSERARGGEGENEGRRGGRAGG